MSTTAAPPPKVAVRATPERKRASGGRVRDWVTNPWGRPRFLVLTTWGYMLWALVPVGLAILFSFNDGRSRSVWQGFSTRWWWGDADLAIFRNPDYLDALRHSLELAALNMVIATPLGVLLAIGLSRWRGRGSRPANFLMLVPLVTPELAMAVALLLVFTQLAVLPFSAVHLGTTAQVIGQVTFSVSYVVVIVRSRLVSIGPEYEEAARDLGANAWQSLRYVLLPQLVPAIFASMLICFALSIDDFVITQYMSSDSNTRTIPMFLYAQARGGSTTPALNALASVLVFVTLIGVGLAYLILRRVHRRTGSEPSRALEGITGMD